MKYFLLATMLVITMNVAAQLPEDIGKSIFESFKNENIQCFAYFITANEFKEAYKERLLHWEKEVDSHETSWSQLAKSYDIDEAVTDETSFIQAFTIKLKTDEQKRWIGNLKAGKKCDALHINPDTYTVLKEEGNEQVFLLVIDSKERYAMKFAVVKIGNTIFLKQIQYGLFYKGSNGKYNCIIGCTSNGKTSKMCSEDE